MTEFLAAYEALFAIAMLNCIFGLSQYLLLRAGVFSLAVPGLAAIGAYTAGILAVRLGAHWTLGLAAAISAAVAAAGLLSIPIGRLRGVFQAIATLSFVLIVQSLVLFWTEYTGGPNGLNGIPQSVGNAHIFLALLVSVYIVWQLMRSTTGHAFDAIRQDETAAVSLGISVAGFQFIAVLLSGALAGLAGGLMAFHNYSVVPEDFGFGAVVLALAYVVVGGLRSVGGPLIGALLLTALPELARPLADNRMIVYGAILMLVMIYLPHGIVDSLNVLIRRQGRASASAAKEVPVHDAA